MVFIRLLTIKDTMASDMNLWTLPAFGQMLSVWKGRLQKSNQAGKDLLQHTNSTVVFSLVSNWLFANIKKFSVASKECIQWRIKISDAEETKKAFKTIRNHFWVNGGILCALPERMRNECSDDCFQVLSSILDAIESWLGISSPGNATERILNLLSQEECLSLEVRQVLRKLHAAFAKENKGGNKTDATGMLAPRATFIEKLMLQGELSSLVGLLVYLLCLPKSPYDVVEETRMRLQYLEEELSETDQELEFRYNAEVVLSGASNAEKLPNGELKFSHHTSSPVRVKMLLKRRSDLLQEIQELQRRVAVRPVPSQYDKLLQDIHQYYDSVCNTKVIIQLIEDFEVAFESLRDLNSTDAFLQSQLSRLRKAEVFEKSMERFISEIQKTYPLYRDITLPVINGLIQNPFLTDSIIRKFTGDGPKKCYSKM